MSTFQKLQAVALAAVLTAGCAAIRSVTGPYETKRDKTAKGAGIGAAAGAVGAVLAGEREADEILAGAAIGAAVGAGVGVYMDRQEERFARIPGTTVERVSEDVLLVHFDAGLLFDVDSSVVRPEGRSTLEQTASTLLEFPKTPWSSRATPTPPAASSTTSSSPSAAPGPPRATSSAAASPRPA